MVDDALPPCTADLEGAVRVFNKEAVECRDGRWRPFAEEGPPTHLWVGVAGAPHDEFAPRPNLGDGPPDVADEDRPDTPRP